MRALPLLLLLMAPALRAAECLPVGQEYSLVLRGVVEYRFETLGHVRTFSLFLHLPSPVCVTGTKYDGSSFKQDNLSVIALGIRNLKKSIGDGEAVVLRGAFWGPAINAPHETVTFAVAEVL